MWRDWESAEPEGGFDAVIGNPPWDRIKLQQVEWFAARREEIALQQRASDRKRMIAALERDGAIQRSGKRGIELVDPALLSEAEIGWWNDYHTAVYATLAPQLEGDDLAWLEEQCAPL